MEKYSRSGMEIREQSFSKKKREKRVPRIKICDFSGKRGREREKEKKKNIQFLTAYLREKIITQRNIS